MHCKRLLLTGGSGFLGGHLALQAAQDGWQVLALGHNTLPLSGPRIEAMCCDLTRPGALTEAVAAWRPDVVVNLAAQSNANKCEQDPEKSRLLNVELPREAASACAARGLKLVHASTDLVFSGTMAPYAEDAPPEPLSEYGRQKAAAEAVVLEGCQAQGTSVCICRLALLYGSPVQTPDTGFFSTMVRELMQNNGAGLTLFSDEYRTPLFVKDAAKGVLLAVEKGSGLLHLGGDERVSRLEFGKRLAAALGKSGEDIQAVPLAAVKMAASRPADVSLCIDKAQALGFAPMPLATGISAAATLWNS